ncbi:MAG: 16S rRNA (cytosine(1402)-N(4))-methyltransferase RsmH [Patescibacteria group bacterium]
MNTKHQPVLYTEALQLLKLEANDNVIDCTVGGAGHSEGILKAIAPRGKLLGFDADPKAIKLVEKKLDQYKNRVTLINSSFSKLEYYVGRYNFKPVVAILLDLGWSTDQLVNNNRGFSYQTNGYLDLRYNSAQGRTAADILNQETEKNLQLIFKNYADERFALPLARAIIQQRKKKKFDRTQDLLDVIYQIKKVKRGQLHPATKIWQALRIAVNDEFEELRKTMPQALNVLKKHGRLAIISFHSGEDRIIKNFIKTESRDCLCSPEVPVCRCQHQASLRLITRKAIKPTLKEIIINPSSHSAHLRIMEKI